jgi:hypothetical protein
MVGPKEPPALVPQRTGSAPAMYSLPLAWVDKTHGNHARQFETRNHGDTSHIG